MSIVTEHTYNEEQNQVILQPHLSVQRCAICMNKMLSDLSCTPCGHVFHKKCINGSLSIKKECPTCRLKTKSEDLIELYYTVDSLIIDVSDRELREWNLSQGPFKEGKVSCDPIIGGEQGDTKSQNIESRENKKEQYLLQMYQKIDLENRALQNQIQELQEKAEKENSMRARLVERLNQQIKQYQIISN